MKAQQAKCIAVQGSIVVVRIIENDDDNDGSLRVHTLPSKTHGLTRDQIYPVVYELRDDGPVITHIAGIEVLPDFAPGPASV